MFVKNYARRLLAAYDKETSVPQIPSLQTHLQGTRISSGNVTADLVQWPWIEIANLLGSPN